MFGCWCLGVGRGGQGAASPGLHWDQGRTEA